MAGIDLRGPSSGSAASTASEYTPLSRITRKPAQLLPVVEASVGAGSSLTLGTFTGAGTLRQVQLTLDTTVVIQNARLQIFVDGETAPSIDADISTLFLTGGDALTNSQSAATDHLITSIKGSSAGGPNWSGGFFFPVPYSNGCVVKIYNPEASGARAYAQIVNHPGEASNYRLRSVCVPAKTPVSVAAQQQVTFFDIPNAKGSLVYLALCALGTGGLTYLERREWVAVDGEPTIPDANGVVTPSFSSSGGEDLFLNGWYFSALSRIINPWVLATSVGGTSNSTVASVDFLGLYGGIPFSTEIAAGWGLKSAASNASMVPFTYGFTALYYVDVTQPFVPSVPRSVAAAGGDTQATITWTGSASSGSSFITGYTITAAPGGVSHTVAASATSYVFTGLTNGTTYTFTVKATSSIGDSVTATTNSVTPAAATAPGAPTGLGVVASNAQTVLTWTAPASNGGSPITNYKVYRSTSSGTETLLTTVGNVLTYTDTGLTNNTTYFYKVSAVNAVGESSLSGEASGTPNNILVADTFTGSDSTTSVSGRTTTTGSKTWAVSNAVAGISSNQAYFSTAGNSGFAYVDAGVSDCTIQVDLSGTVTNAGIAFRWVDQANNFGMDTSGLWRHVAGAFTSLGSFSSANASGDTVIVVLSGSSITVKRVRSGSTTTILGPVTDTNFTTATKHGITSFNDTAARFDNFQISA